MLPNILQVFDAVSKVIWRFIEPRINQARIISIHYVQFLVYLIFFIVRTIVIICQQIRWRQNGLAKKLAKINDGLAYDESAHIMNVLWACKATPTDKMRNMQFIASHHQLAHPKCVLDEDWMPVDIMPDYAVFVQLKKPLLEYTARHVTFLWADLAYEARRIAIMPLTSLQRLSIEMGKPKDDGANVTFLWGGGRCGSTLIAKMVEAADPDHLVLSEPPILIALYMFKRTMRPQRLLRLVECATRVLVKPIPGKPKLYIKPIFFTVHIAGDVHKVLPKARMLYSYRKPLRLVWAHERAFGMTPYYVGVHCALWTNQWERGHQILGFYRTNIIDYVSSRVLGMGFFDVCCIIWADNFMRYFGLAQEFYFPAIIYERLYDNPVQFCAEVLAFSGVSLARIQDALDLLKGDSQEGSIFSQSLLKGLRVTPFTPSRKARTDRFCDALNLPRLEMDGSYQPSKFPPPTFSSAPSEPGQSVSQNSGEPDFKFITDASQVFYECVHAGTGSASSVSRAAASASAQQLVSNGAPKRQLGFEPYYKPLPLQIIFSRD